MVGVFVICFIVFPISFFWNICKVFPSGALLDKQDSDIVKGIATSFVILAHLTNYLEDTGGGYNKALSFFSVMGGMGVLLFFFLSGYGLYKGYEEKQIEVKFWKKRLTSMYLPCIVIQLVFGIIKAVSDQSFVLWKVVIDGLFGAWFIDVILIQYFIFFMTGIISGGKRTRWIISCFLFSIVVAFLFWKLKMNARWYNGLMLFPFGMLIAYSEKKLIPLIDKKWKLFFISNTLLFSIMGLFFTLYKGKFIWIDIVKTFSGMCLSMMVCIVFMKIKPCSRVMLYMGKRSLYFYLVHINMITVLNSIERLDAINVFFFVLLSTFLVVEIFYRIVAECFSRLGKRGN